MKSLYKYALVCGTALALSGVASAQEQTQSEQNCGDSDDPDCENKDQIVVTGTLVRGIAPVGANIVGLSANEIKATGATDTNQLLTQLPQSNYFLAVPQPSEGTQAGISRVPVNRPNLRNLPGGTSSSGQITLVLLDSHSVVPMGVEQSVVDAGMIPAGILQRVETILDGSSALYGSDAVGGVINFIPRKRYDGLDASARYTFADGGYDAVNIDVTAGTNWTSGGIVLSYSYATNSELLYGERDYSLTRNYYPNGVNGAFDPDGVFTGLDCADRSHVTAGGSIYVANTGSSALTPGANYCPINQFDSLTPAQDRHSVFGALEQDITDNVKFDLTGFYFWRKTRQNFGAFQGTARIPTSNPYYRPIAGNTSSQTVNFNYGPIYGFDADYSDTISYAWQLTPGLELTLGAWRIRNNFTYGKSEVRINEQRIDTALERSLVNGTSFSTAINPYDILATQNAALFDDLVYTQARVGRHEMYQARSVADGPLFTLPGGDVKAAIGVEWTRTHFERTAPTNVTASNLLVFQGATAESKSVFGELVVPIFDTPNSMPGFQRLIISVSGRFDDYVDVGSTFNPKVGLSWDPIEWVTLRGSYGTSFRAPNAVDKLGSAANLIRCIGSSNTAGCLPFITGQFPSGVTQTPTSVFLFLTGTDDNLVPETSKNWSIGIDIAPPIPGPGVLKLSASYYEIDFSNRIALPSGGNLQPFYQNFPNLFYVSPSAQTLQDFVNEAPNSGPQVLDFVETSGYNLQWLVDARTRNLSRSIVGGVDASISYSMPTSFGSLDMRVNGSWLTKDKSQISSTTSLNDNLEPGQSLFRMTAVLGAEVGPVRAQATWRHQQGYDLTPSANQPDQDHIGSFSVVDLNFRYAIEADSYFARDWVLTFGVQNVFNEHPPFIYSTSGSTANGQTLGRVFQLGASKEF